ncbi:MAG TPA: hypothetical protein VIY69_13980 [Candidatus Acidoferrales bacterium]
MISPLYRRVSSKKHRAGFAIGFACATLFVFSGCSFGPTNASVQLAAPPPLQYMGDWGIKGTGPGQLDQPTSIATDMRGNVYIADPGSQFIDKFQPGGTPLLSFQQPGLKHPQEIAVDRGGAIYVTDPVRVSVFVFLPDGSRYREIRIPGRGNEENTLDVAVDDAGSLDILDVDSAKLYDFNPRFHLAHVWKPGMGGPHGPGRPTSVVSGPSDSIFVGGLGNDSLLRFYDGKFAAQVSLAAGSQADSSSATPDAPSNRIGDQFAVSANYIFLVDPDGKTLHVWTLDGKPKAALDLSAQLGDDRHSAPPIAVTPSNDLLVLDTQKARVYHYHLNL